MAAASSVFEFKKEYFLPRDFLSDFPKDAFLNQVLKEIALGIPTRLHTKSLRSIIDELNTEYGDAVLTVNNPQERKLLILVLAMLTQAYIWEDLDNPATEIPRLLGKNLHRFCLAERRVPTLIYADYILYNWRLKNRSAGMSLENLEVLFSFTADENEIWFIKIHIMIEYAFEKAYGALEKAENFAYTMVDLDSITDRQVTTLIKLLNEIAESFKNAINTMQRMKERLTPDYFYHHYRSFLQGWNKAKEINKRGVVLNGVVDLYIRDDYIGPSGAQSSAIPKLDAAFEIKHTTAVKKFRQYMPAEHVKLIEASENNMIATAVRISKSRELCAAYENARAGIVSFRLSHKKLVEVNLEQPADKKGINPATLEGTGGTVSIFLEDNIQASSQKNIISSYHIPRSRL